MCDVITANYEVIRFIEHGSRCRPAMDCVQGELLIYRVRRCPEIEKETLFAWIKQLIIQIEQYHRCRNNQCYRYINPYSVLITKEEEILLLDMEVKSNEFVLKNMQKRAMREHFVKPIVHIRENTRITLDLYGYAKTVQFMLASMKPEPALTKWEEHRLAKMIGKCLSEESKKQYTDLKQIEKDLPAVRRGRRGKLRKRGLAGAAILLLSVGIFAVIYGWKETLKQSVQVQAENNVENTKADSENSALPAKVMENGPEDILDAAEEKVEVLEQYLLRNTSKDNQEIILQGEETHRELLRCLAAVYDREQSKEQALQVYQTLCIFENQTEYLEAAYTRRIALEKEMYPEEKHAVETGREAVGRFPASEALAREYAEAVCVSTELEQEEKMSIVQPLIERFPVIRDSESYRKLETKQQEAAEGNTETAGEGVSEEQAADSTQESIVEQENVDIRTNTIE